MTTGQPSASTGPGAARVLKMGIIGIGVGATQIMPQMESLPEVELVAGADINPKVRETFAVRYPNASIHDRAEGLCADPNVDAVWVSTPNHLHCPPHGAGSQCGQACGGGKAHGAEYGLGRANGRGRNQERGQTPLWSHDRFQPTGDADATYHPLGETGSSEDGKRLHVPGLEAPGPPARGTGRVPWWWRASTASDRISWTRCGYWVA